MKAQTSGDSSVSASSTVVSTPETASIADSDATTEVTTLNGTETQPGNASMKSDADKGKGKNTKGDVAPKSKSSTDNLIGKLNNLVTTDLQNIVEGRDFVMLGMALHNFLIAPILTCSLQWFNLH